MKNSKNIKKNDLNSMIIRDNHEKQIFNSIIRSRLILTAVMVLLQLFLIISFIIKLQKYIEYYFIVSIILSVSFMVYLTNKQGRNEFKIAWCIPVMIFPLLGVVFYSLYLNDNGEKRVKKALQRSKAEIADLTGVIHPDEIIKKNYSQIEDLQTYLINQNFLPYEHNQIDYFPTGEDFLTDFIQELRNAKEFIFIETFILKIEETWDMILGVLEEKAKEGVEVRVMYDAFGSQMASDRNYVKYLKSKNIKTCVFNPMIPIFTTKQNSRDHRKIYLIDGKICYSGGINLANEYFNYGKNYFPYWKDNAIKIQGEAVKGFITMFLQNWNMQRCVKEQEDYIKYLNIPCEKYDYSGITIPYGDDPYNYEDIAENVYLYMVHSAKKYLHITSPYVILDNNFQEALVFAAKRGIEVKIIVPSVPDHFIAFYIGKTFLKTLVDNGIKVYLYKKGFIHAKTFISDNKTATVGSINLDYRSFYHHFECGTVIHENPIIAQIEKDFQNTLKDCEEMTPHDYKKIHWFKRFLGRFFRIIAPLM